MTGHYYHVENYYVIARIAQFENPDGTINLGSHVYVFFNKKMEIIGSAML